MLVEKDFGVASNQFRGFRKPQVSHIKAKNTNIYICGTTTRFHFPWCLQRCFASDTNMVINYLIDMLTRWIYYVLLTRNKCFYPFSSFLTPCVFINLPTKKNVWRCSSCFCNKASLQPKQTNIHDAIGHYYTKMRHIIGAWYNAWYHVWLLFSAILTSTVYDFVIFI